MYVHGWGAAVRVEAPAKLNLFLEVLSKRADGFHEIETLMIAVNLFDTLYFIADGTGQVTFTGNWISGLRGPGKSESPSEGVDNWGDLPEGADNIVLRAVQLLRRRAGVEQGARLRLVKRIPSAAGLGGASSDAAAALVAGNRAWKLGWSREQLQQLAAELGSDVPFFLGPGAAVCRGRGERIEPLGGLARLHFVLVRPPAGLSTQRVYQQCQPADRPAHVEPLVSALRGGNTAAAARLMVNRLQGAARSLSPWIERLSREMDRTDCLGHQMSGSGTSYLGICRNARHARRMAGRLQGRWLGRVWHTSSASRPVALA